MSAHSLKQRSLTGVRDDRAFYINGGKQQKRFMFLLFTTDSTIYMSSQMLAKDPYFWT
jgi:hypothetical protein